MKEGIPLTETILKINGWEDLDKLSDKYLVLHILKRKYTVKEPHLEYMQPAMPPVSPPPLRAKVEPSEGIHESRLIQKASVKVNLMEVHVTTKSF